MGVNKVIYYGEVLVDMSQVTVTPETLGKGATALDSKGDLITGTHECKETEPKLQSKTVTPTTSLQTVNPDSGYDGLSKVTVNAMPTATQATPSISVSSAGLITASATQSAGYVASGTKQATKQLTVQAAQTITPSTSDKTIASGRYLTGTQTIKGDANLVAGNIKSGVSIFGVAGSYEGSSSAGGDSGSEPTIVSGTTTISIPTSSAAAKQTEVVTVKGLGFKPFCVMVRCRNTIKTETEGINFFISCQMASGVKPMCLRATKPTAYNYSAIYTGNQMIAYIEFIEDGFTLRNGSFTNMYYPPELDYIAIG